MGKEDLGPITLHYEGIFDFDGLYAAVIDWAKNYGYMWVEKTYKHKVPSPKGAELEMDWSITKKATEFIQYKVNFEVHAWEMSSVELEENGNKRELTKARIRIVMKGTVDWDWQKKFKNAGKFGKWLGKAYDTAKMKDISQHFDTLYYRMWDVHAIIKKFFDMQTKKYEYKNYLGES